MDVWLVALDGHGGGGWCDTTGRTVAAQLRLACLHVWRAGARWTTLGHGPFIRNARLDAGGSAPWEIHDETWQLACRMPSRLQAPAAVSRVTLPNALGYPHSPLSGKNEFQTTKTLQVASW